MPRYKFITGCPVCGDRELHHWTHATCGGEEEIDEDGDIYCLECRTYLGFIMDIRFNCTKHNSMEGRDAPSVLHVLAMMTDFPADFGKKITKKILENCVFKRKK